jgi:hypothetical protein
MPDMMNTPVTPEMLQEKDREINELNDTIAEQKSKLFALGYIGDNRKSWMNGELKRKIESFKRSVALYYSAGMEVKDKPISPVLGNVFKNYINHIFGSINEFIEKYGMTTSRMYVRGDEYKTAPIENDYSTLTKDELSAELDKKNETISDKKCSVSILGERLAESDAWESFKYHVRVAASHLEELFFRAENNTMKMDAELAKWYRDAFVVTCEFLNREIDLDEACRENGFEVP